VKSVIGVSAGALLLGRESLLRVPNGWPQIVTGAVKRREVRIGGKRVKTVDAHCYVIVPEVSDMLKGTNLESAFETRPISGARS